MSELRPDSESTFFRYRAQVNSAKKFSVFSETYTVRCGLWIRVGNGDMNLKKPRYRRSNVDSGEWFQESENRRYIYICYATLSLTIVKFKSMAQ